MQATEGLTKMNVSTKASLLAGADFWKTKAIPELGIDSIMLTDGPHGLRKQAGVSDHLGLNDSVPATCFPAECLSACSFDPDLMRQVGQAIGEECVEQEVSVLLGPGVNIKRNPLCGRNFEYFSEDPLLAGKMGAAMVDGVQSTGVGTSVKHFAANSQEKARMISDSLVDDRALNEIYLRPFEIVVREAQPATVMTAYNKLNGTYCSQNSFLMEKKLREEWAFKGACITDWGALDDSIAAVQAGLDLVMPGPRPDHVELISEAIKDASLDIQKLDDATNRMLALIERYKADPSNKAESNTQQHLEIARKMAEASAVLLDNDGILPISAENKIAVIGEFARTPRYQGAGSSKINPIELDCALDALKYHGLDLTFAPGYTLDNGKTNTALLKEAEQAAASSDIAVVFVGLPDSYESEGFDRAGMEMPEGHLRLLETVCLANPRTVVVLYGGAPIELPWISKTRAKGKWGLADAPIPAAVLAMYLPGCQGGKALSNLLLGNVSPSGKLAETWPLSLADTALDGIFPDPARQIRYRESIYVGYRYYDSANVEPAYPFGHGLSYTKFDYSDLQIHESEDSFNVSVQISNTGKIDAAETVQVYVHAINPAVFMPEQQLVGFKKVFVAAGQHRQVDIHLDKMAFSYWDSESNSFVAEAGDYEIRVSASSRDIKLRQNISLVVGQTPFEIVEPKSISEKEKQRLKAYYEPSLSAFSDESFDALYGRALPEEPEEAKSHLCSRNTPIGDLRKSRIGRLIIKIMQNQAKRTTTSPEDDVSRMMEAMFEDMPLRGITMGGVSMSKVDGIVDIMNGKVLSGIQNLLSRS